MCFLACSVIVPTISGIFFQSSIIEILASVSSLVVAILAAKARIEAKFLIFISVMLYVFVSIEQHLYGEALYCLVLLIPLNVYGIFNWLKNKRNDKKKGQLVIISQTNPREVAILFLSQIVMGFGYYFMLKSFNTNLLLLSTFSIMTAVMATYLVNRRSALGMFCWLLNDFVVIVMWGVIVFDGSANAVPLLILVFMCMVNDVYGIFSWRALWKAQNDNKSLAK